MKKKSKKTVFNKISLPSTIIDRVKSLDELTQQEQNEALIIISIIANTAHSVKHNISAYVELSSQWLKFKVIGNHYSKILKILIQKKILFHNGGYIVGTAEISGKCMSYAINQHNWNGEYVKLSASCMLDILEDDNQLCKLAIRTLKKLTINKEKCLNIIERKINDITIDTLHINDSVKDSTLRFRIDMNGDYYGFKDKSGRFNTYFSRDYVIKLAKERNMDLIQAKDSYYVMNINDFIVKYKQMLNSSYVYQIEQLCNGIFRASINDTNGRMDTSLTNLCSELKDQIYADNDMIELDFVNSQYTFFVNWIESDNIKDSQYYNTKTLKKSDDFKRFKELVLNGELYEGIQKICGFKSRSEAKTAMFHITFASQDLKSENKELVRQAFPEVINWIDSYKLSYGYKSFSVKLQNLESNLFIQKIFKRVTKRFITSKICTVHDSIAMSSDIFNEVKTMIDDMLKKENFNYKFKEKENKSIQAITEDLTVNDCDISEKESEPSQAVESTKFTPTTDLEFWNYVRPTKKRF